MNRNFTALCAALLMCAILIVLFGGFTFNKFNPALAVISEGDRSEKVVFLTFDDGPSDKVTPKILDVLKEEKVKATFFIIGKNAELRRNIIKREADEGHTVAVHSYSHVYSDIYSSPEKLVEDIDKCNAVIKQITGKPSSVYRFPGGSYGLSQKLIEAVISHGMRYVDWNASTRDAEILNATPEKLYSAAVSTTPGSNYVVLLAHDSTTKSSTAQALKKIISFYREHNYSFASF